MPDDDRIPIPAPGDYTLPIEWKHVLDALEISRSTDMPVGKVLQDALEEGLFNYRCHMEDDKDALLRHHGLIPEEVAR